MEDGGWRRGPGLPSAILYLLSSILLLSPARAQAPDTLAAPLAPEGPQPGRPVTPVPALTPALDATDLLEAVPGAFVFDLGAPGWPHGLALDGLPPEAHALTLDGLPYDDLFTGRPREDLLPLELLDRVGLAVTRYGRPGTVVATVRPFRAEAPVMELRYLPGQEGIQYVSAAHAQTRRLPAFLRDAAGRGRLTALGWVAGRQATGPYVGEDLGGWHALGRLTVARPGLAAELTEHHVRHTQGARAGLSPPAGADFPTVFDPLRAVVLLPEAERQSERNDLALALRAPVLGAEPLTLEAWWTRQHERYTAGGLDTLTAKGNRFGGRLAQPLAAGRHGLLLRLDGWLDGAPWGTNNPYAGAGTRLHLHAALRDTLAVGGWRVEAEAGAHAVGGAVWPVAMGRIERGRVFAGAYHAAESPTRVAEVGYAGVVTELGEDATLARTTGVEVGFAFTAGPLALRARLYASQTADPIVPAEVGADSLAFQQAALAFRRAGASLTLAWRSDAPRGLYAAAEAHAFRFLNPAASALHGREADALPALWGHGRFGLRFLDLFGGALDLDLAAHGRAWTGFRSRAFVPAPALFALPDPAVTTNVPARGTLDLAAEARLQDRASVFVRYENVLATRLYSGAYVVPVYPIAPHRLRFGVFWALFN